MKIEHNSYEAGLVESVVIVDNDGKKIFSSGVMLPRERAYDFGIAERQEIITVTAGGVLVINDQVVVPGDSCAIEVGDPIMIEAREPSAYVCVYGN